MAESTISSVDWKDRWETGNTGWDLGHVNAALEELVEEKTDKVNLPRGRGIVPGCGSGYDVVYLAKNGFKMTGLDLSSIAVDAGNKLRDEQKVAQDSARFLVGDFFNFSLGGEKFMLAYDYTFFCAIHPDMREKWGARYAEIIEAGGNLITLMFPLKQHTSTPPPYTVSEEEYHRVLDTNFELVYIDRNPREEPNRKAPCAIAVWRRK
ncbi:putative thiol methyltransferase 2 [Zancudomyces culisetae]|uniref:Putative thiol methyltransferase 2 n=1 Tax=Zancudomyces culisetae TaxID=1213189 RepID=A0A1R1PIJ3_ZANCU|nr:putative thiol methyltransferase 2 [Zancudomyces culisetae]OMH80842.1 putative thiol methyltransferase 2 [Zancudomyces culisetae]|eukprot:OMH80801.1 putative thiol methyltransferase 2 [Zancudomyces culisetae]